MNNGSAGRLLLGAKSYKFTKNGFGYSFKYLVWEKNSKNPNSSFDFLCRMGGYGDPPIPPPIPSHSPPFPPIPPQALGGNGREWEGMGGKGGEWGGQDSPTFPPKNHNSSWDFLKNFPNQIFEAIIKSIFGKFIALRAKGKEQETGESVIPFWIRQPYDTTGIHS